MHEKLPCINMDPEPQMEPRFGQESRMRSAISRPREEDSASPTTRAQAAGQSCVLSFDQLACGKSIRLWEELPAKWRQGSFSPRDLRELIE